MPPFPRPQAALRASQSILRTPSAAAPCSQSTPAQRRSSPSNAASPTAVAARRNLSNTSQTRMAEHSDHSSHESHYEAPTGWLWGIPPGQKYEKEGWEGLMYWGFYGSLVAAAVAYAWKPDTSIETWALEEAKRRLQAEGLLPEDE